MIDFVPLNKNVRFWAKAKSACRIDLAGGWTDTPPITYQCQNSNVLNVSVKVNGKVLIII